MKKYILYLFLIFASGPAFAQLGSRDTLAELLKDKKNFNEISLIVGRYYQNRPTGKGTGYNQWLRWFWYNRDRLDEAGNITNTTKRTEEAMEQVNKEFTGRNNASQNAINSGIPTWQSLGPTNYTSLANDYGWGLGRIDRIAFHPTNAAVFYVGTAAGGVWKTVNYGNSWIHVTPEFPLQSISGIVCSYSDPNTLYVMTGDGEATGYFNYMNSSSSSGIYKSVNGGSTWTKVRELSNERGYSLVQNPANPETIYACTSSGIFVTVNGGESWTFEYILETRELLFHPQHNDIAFADRGNNGVVLLYMPDDHTFVDNNSYNTGTNISGKAGVAIAISPNQPNTLMVIAGKGAGTKGQDFAGLYKCVFSYNYATPSISGMTISTVRTTPNILGGDLLGDSAGGQAMYDLGLALKPTNANMLITAGLCVWRSTDQAVSNMTSSTIYFYKPLVNKPYIHPDVHKVVYNPLNDYLYALTDGGIYVSTDDGVTWTEKTKGMNITQFYSISGVENSPDRIMGGTQDNGTFYRKSNTSNFKRVRGADGFSTAINPNNTDIIYWTENEKVLKSPDGGTSIFEKKVFVSSPIERGSFPEVRLNSTFPDTIIAFNKDSLLVSKNGGDSWAKIYAFGVRDVSFCGDNNSKVFIATASGRVRICNNIFAATPTFSPVTVEPPLVPVYTRIVTFPSYSNFVWVGSSNYSKTNKVMFSEDGGATAWQNKTGSLPALPINCMAVDNSGNLYVGTDIGIFVRGLGDADWTPFFNGLPRVPVTGLVVNNASGLLRASTLGLGVWSTTLFSACNPTETYTSTYYGQYYLQASSTINSSAIILGSEGTNVVFKAGSAVILQPGFVAEKGSVMRAIIGPCNSGIPQIINTAAAESKMIIRDEAVDRKKKIILPKDKVKGKTLF